MAEYSAEKTHIFLKEASLFYKDICPEEARFLMPISCEAYTLAFARDPANLLCIVQACNTCESEHEAECYHTIHCNPSGWQKTFYILQTTVPSPCLGKTYGRRQQTEANARPDTFLCRFCFQWLQSDCYRVRLRPKRKPSARLQRLLRRQAAGRRLSLKHAEIVKRFRKSSNTLMATCHSCNQTSRHVGVSRDFMASLSKSHSTPGSAGKRKTPQSAKRGTPKSTSSERTPTGTPRSIPSEATSSSSSKAGSVKKSAFSRLRKLLMLEDNQKSKRGGLKDFLSSL